MGVTDTPSNMRINAQGAIMREDWETAVGLLREFIPYTPRDPAPFRLLEMAARKSNQPELAQAAAENLAGIQDLEKRLTESILEIGTDVEDAEKRLKVASLSADLGRMPQAREWILAAGQVAAERQSEFVHALQKIQLATEPLVALPDEKASDDDSESADETTEVSEEETNSAEPSSDENSGAPATTSTDPSSDAAGDNEEPSESDSDATSDETSPDGDE